MAFERAGLAGVGVARGRGRPGWGRRAAVWLVVHRARILASVAALSILVGGALYLSGEHAAASDVCEPPEANRAGVLAVV